MASPKHILFPIDFSPQVKLAVPHVTAFARQLGARLTIMNAVPRVWAGEGPQPEFAAEFEASAQERLDQALDGELRGLAVDRTVRSGDPAEQIARVAEDQAIDLIMMPAHGHGVFRGLLLGSLTAKILHDVRCPVWIATHTEEPRVRPIPRTVVCCVDGTSRSVDLMRWAAEFSAGLGAILRLLHIVPPVTDWDAVESERELQDEEREAAHARAEELRKQAGIAVPLRVVVGPIAPTVAEQAREDEADLLIVGRGDLDTSLGRLRTHTFGIIQRSPCPVISA